MAVDIRYCRWGGVDPILRNIMRYASNFLRFGDAMYSCNGMVSFVIKIPAHPNIEIRNSKKKKRIPTLKAVTKISLLFFICDFLLLHWKVFNFAPLLLVAFYVKGNPKEHKVYDTRCSQAVPHPSTILARRCLTSVIGRERVCSSWYGRRRRPDWFLASLYAIWSSKLRIDLPTVCARWNARRWYAQRPGMQT